MKNIYLYYEEDRTGGHDKPGQKGYLYKCREDEVITFDPISLQRTHPECLYTETIKVEDDLYEKDALYMLVVRYSTSDTFGKTRGSWSIQGVFESKEKAIEHKKKIFAPDYEEYKPWEGEEFENVEIHRLVLLDKDEDYAEDDYKFVDHT